jgi:protein phosphatase
VSDVGRVRAANEDNLLARDGLFVVADGMGGHSGGEVASSIAVEVMGRVGDEPAIEDLVDQVRRANDEIIGRAGGDPSLSGMGTTLCAVARLSPTIGGLGLVNVGDSRIYLFADGALTQISEDHSLVETLIREGQLRPEDASEHPHRNVVTRALGISDELPVDSWHLRAGRGARLLLCSDGLVGEVGDERIEAVLSEVGSPGDAARDLVDLANGSGGRDNITVIVVDVVGGTDEAADSEILDAAVHNPDRSAGSADDDLRAEEGLDGVVPPQPGGRVVRVPRPRLVTSLVAVVAVAALALVLVGRYARDNYYVALDEVSEADSNTVEVRQVVVFKGRPGGFLWFDPTVEERTALVEIDLTDALVLELEDIPEFDSLDDARAYVVELEERIAEASVGE